MSFITYKKNVDYGDTVIIYIGFENMLQFEVVKGKMHQTKYGAIKHDDLIGVSYGKKLLLTRGFVYLLHPTPELWSVTLKHRTQILYCTDISLIISQLDLKPGSVVVESGTGSGSLSHSILRTITPGGRLHTFDFHALRSDIAANEFKSHGFDSTAVVVKHRDVCRDGFDLESEADAVFLDLPKPWLAIPFAKQALVPGGRICSFSPCIEQVQKTCTTLATSGFVAIETWECLNCPLEVRTMSLPIPDLGFNNDNIKVNVNINNDNNLVRSNNMKNEPTNENFETIISADCSKCMQVDDEEDKSDFKDTLYNDKSTDIIIVNNHNQDCVIHSPPVGILTYDTDLKKCQNKQQSKHQQNKNSAIKKFKTQQNKEPNSNAKQNTTTTSSNTIPNIGSPHSLHRTHSNKPLKMNLTFKSCMPSLTRAGHTGYLTFATLYPS